MGSGFVRYVQLSVLVALCVSFSMVVHAGDARYVEPLLAVRKNTGVNRVEYGVRVDEACRPAGSAPIYPYFRWLTRGPNLRRELSLMEARAYGVKEQKVRRTERGGSVSFALRALPARWMHLEVKAAAGGCAARVLMKIGGHNARLLDVYLVLTGPLNIDHVEVTGHKLVDESRVIERISP
jgi:hypothetical protein